MATFYGNIQKTTAAPPFNPIDANTVAQWRFENDKLDSTTNGYDLTTNGTVPFSTTNGVWDGSYSVGPFSGNLINSATKGLAGASGWTVEGYFQLTSTSSQYIFMGGNSIPDHFALLLHLGQIRCVVDDAIRITSSESVTTGVKYYWAIRSNGSNDIELFFGLASSAPISAGVATGAGYGVWPASDVTLLGANFWSPGTWPFTGYHDYITISNIARTTLPTLRPDGETPINAFALWEFENNLIDSSVNGFIEIENGTIPFATSPSPPASIGGTYSSGPFSDVNYLDHPTNLESALSNNDYFFETYVNFNSLANQPVIFYHTQSGIAFWMQGLSDGSAKVQWGGSILGVPASTITTGVWYYMAVYMFSGNGNSEFYISPATSISATPTATLNFNTAITTITAGIIGRYPSAGGFNLNGYLKNTRYTIGVPNSIPIT